jgi:AcrR family transcriptional regulator
MLPDHMAESPPVTSPRREELLEHAYRYVLEHGVADLSLRPLAAAVGSSPRVLLFLFGNKAELVQALLWRARQDELDLLSRVRSDGGGDLATLAAELWGWLAAEEHRPLLKLWVEGYARSLVEPRGPWAGFARTTVNDWLDVLGDAQSAAVRKSRAGEQERTAVLAVLRGALLDLLATGDATRTSRAVERQLASLRPRSPSGRHRP